MIRKCDCKNQYQDEQYGQGMRVQNPCKPNATGPKQVRCTSCGKEQLIPVEKKNVPVQTEAS